MMLLVTFICLSLCFLSVEGKIIYRTSIFDEDGGSTFLDICSNERPEDAVSSFAKQKDPREAVQEHYSKTILGALCEQFRSNDVVDCDGLPPRKITKVMNMKKYGYLKDDYFVRDEYAPEEQVSCFCSKLENQPINPQQCTQEIMNEIIKELTKEDSLEELLEGRFKSDNYYIVLGLDYQEKEVKQSHITESQIKSSFRKLALSYHPDKHSSDKQNIDTYTEIFRLISVAYETLSDSSLREQHEYSLRPGIQQQYHHHHHQPSGQTTTFSFGGSTISFGTGASFTFSFGL